MITKNKYIKFSLLVYFFCCNLVARAQDIDSIKDNVFKDCSSALQETSTLDTEYKRNLIEYLIRVIEIQKDAPRPKIYEQVTIPSQPGYLTNNPANTLRRLELLKAYEPERDEEAKDCAIELLKSLIPYSFEATPRLIELCGTNTIDLPHKNKIQKLVWQLTLATKSNIDYHIPTKTISGLAEVLSSDEGYLAENILYELSPNSLIALVAELKKPNRQKRHNIIKLLLRLDPDGKNTGAALMPYLNTSDDNLRLETVMLLGKLKSIHPSALQPIVDATNDPATEVANAAYQSLIEIMTDSNLAINYEHKDVLFATLISNLDSALPNRRDLIKDSLGKLVNYVSDPIPQIISLLQNKEDDLKLSGLNLTKILRNKDIKLFNVTQNLLYHPSVPVRRESITTLSQFAEPFAKDAAKALQRLLKTQKKKVYSSATEEMILDILQATTNLPLSYSEDFQSYFIDALGYRALGLTDPNRNGQNTRDTRHPAVLAVANLGEKGNAIILKALKNKNNIVRIRALYALQTRKSSSLEVQKQLIILLKDQNYEIRDEAQKTLVAFGENAKPELQKALSYSNFNARYGAAKALLDLGELNSMVTLALIEGLKQENCRNKGHIGAALKNTNTVIKTEIEDQLVNCLQGPGQEKDDTFEAITRLAPLEQQTLTKIVSGITEKRFSDNLILSLGEKGEMLGFSSATLVNALKGYLSNPNNTNKARAINALGNFGNNARSVLPEIQVIFNDQNQEDLIRHKALVAITKIDPANLFFKKYLIDELLSEKSAFALTALSEIAPALSLPLIVEVFDRLPPEIKPNALKLFEHYSTEAKKFGDFVTKQLYAPNPLIRVHAISIILRANISYPELLNALRTELIGKYYDYLADNNMPAEPLTTILKEIIAAPLSRTELKNTETLLIKILHPTG